MMKVNDDFDPFGLKSKPATLHDGTAEDVLTNHEEAIGVVSSHFNDKGVEGQQIGASPTQVSKNLDDKSETVDTLNSDALIPPPTVSRVTRPALPSSSTGNHSAALPPKLTIKVTIHEEVSSFSQSDVEGASNVTVEGSISAQIQCSDSKRNAPFCLDTAGNHDKSLVIRTNPAFSTDYNGERPSIENFLYVPKHELGFVPIATYFVSSKVQHMPLLLERKVSVNGTTCRVAIQVRSKLSNRGDIEDFSIALAVPEFVDGNALRVQRGDGVFDELKRTVKWKRPFLKKGESFMVSIQTELLEEISKKELRFPVMLRCCSKSDQISSVDFRAVKAEGYPASITLYKSFSFLLLHRLP